MLLPQILEAVDTGTKADVNVVGFEFPPPARAHSMESRTPGRPYRNQLSAQGSGGSRKKTSPGQTCLLVSLWKPSKNRHEPSPLALRAWVMIQQARPSRSRQQGNVCWKPALGIVSRPRTRTHTHSSCYLGTRNIAQFCITSKQSDKAVRLPPAGSHRIPE